jgi:hypothetical protein
MKGKVIYVDFASRTRKDAYAETPIKKGVFARLIDGIRMNFRFSEESGKLRNETYNFKHMM